MPKLGGESKLKVGRTLTILLFALFICAAAWAQDAVRYSIASERAAEARKRTRSETDYNLDLDPVKLRFSATVGAEFNDNINLASTNQLSDYVLRLGIGTRAFWPISDRNTLDLNVNIGYEHYINGTRPSRVTLTGDEGSGLFFDIYVGDFMIELHDKFSLSQDPSADPSVSGIADIFRLENTLGTTVTWDLDKLVLDFNYDHFNYVPLDNIYKYLAHQSELGSIRVAATLNPALSAGLELGGGATSYNESQLSDNRHVSIGPFVRYQISHTADVRASFGYTQYWFDPASGNTNSLPTNSPPLIASSTSQTGFYADVTFTHNPTERTSQTLNFGQSLSTDINSRPIQLLYVRYSVALNIIRHWSFRPYFTFESGTESLGLNQEDLTRYGAGLSVSRQITQKFSSAVSYQWLNKTSSLAERDYNQNRLVLDLVYQF